MSKFKAVLAVLGVVVLAAPAAHANTFGVEVFGAFNTYTMEDVNDALAADNALGANYDDLASGMTGGLGMRMCPNPNWMFTACWEPLFLESESTPTNSTWNMDASSFQVSAYRMFPSNNPNTRYGLGAGIGMYTVQGSNTDPALTPTTIDIEGSGPGFHVMGMGEWTMTPSFNVTGSAGFRFASIEIDGSNNNATADYSGFMARAGMVFYFPQSK